MALERVLEDAGERGRWAVKKTEEIITFLTQGSKHLISLGR